MIEGRRVLVENIPAKVCERCGEATFSRQTTENIRKLAHETRQPVRTVPMEVFAMVWHGSNHTDDIHHLLAGSLHTIRAFQVRSEIRKSGKAAMIPVMDPEIPTDARQEAIAASGFLVGWMV
jgi:hypothetical protein